MDFKDLSYVLAIARYQNITKAANSLYVTQPTLTKFLQNLESELGQSYSGSWVTVLSSLMPGNIMWKSIGDPEPKKELDQEMNDIVKNNYGSLKIAFPTMRGTYMLPCTLPIFNSLYPNVRLEILESHSYLLEDMLLNAEADLAFFNLPVKSPGC